MGRGRCGTKPDSLLKTEIPIRTGTWDLTQPGYLEADSVAHCGTSLAGDFIWSLTYTDICSGWTEGRAVWNKGAAGVVAATQEVEESLPFELLGFDCDNGSEFLNHPLWGYLAKRQSPVEFTRSRPYHKNDNAHVEQKNMGTGDLTKLSRFLNAGKHHELIQIVPIRAPLVFVVDVCEPFDLGRGYGKP